MIILYMLYVLYYKLIFHVIFSSHTFPLFSIYFKQPVPAFYNTAPPAAFCCWGLGLEQNILIHP